MKKKSIVVMATFLVLALGMAMANAANSPGDVQTGPPVAAPTQEIQPAPPVAAPPQNYPGDPVGPHYHGARYYPGWGCGYYHRGIRGNSYRGWWGCGWGC